MVEVCECCGQRLPEHPDPVAELAAWCRERGLWVSADGEEVRTQGAAALLGVSEQWLRQSACYFCESTVPSRRVGRHRLWRLAEIARRIDNV